MPSWWGTRILFYGVDSKVRGGKLNWIKYFIWIPWISLITVMFISSSGIRKFDFLYQTYYGISVISVQGYIIYYAVLSIIVFPGLLIGKRAFCHYVCWMAPFMIIGSKIKNKFNYPSLRLEQDKSKCINCKLCDKKCPFSSLNFKSWIRFGF